MSDAKKNIAIVGFGRFGRVFADMLSAFHAVHILSHNNLKSDTYPVIEPHDLPTMDWVIFCVPISALNDTLSSLAPHISPRSIVFDVCSIKTYPRDIMQKHLPHHQNLLGTHPLFGPDSLTNPEKEIVLCPITADKSVIDALQSIFEQQQLTVHVMTPEQHDQESAWNLALVHFLGRGLLAAHLPDTKTKTLSYMRLLDMVHSVSQDTDTLFRDMQNLNPYAQRMRTRVLQELTDLDTSL